MFLFVVIKLSLSLSSGDPGHPPLSVSDYIERMALIHSSNSDILEEEYHVSLVVLL